MNIVLEKALPEHQLIIQNLARFYVYDMYKYCGQLPGWEIPPDGLFEGHDLSKYWTESARYPFLIKVDNELAGFVLVNKIGTTSDVDWNVGEFFVCSKYQGKGVGSQVAEKIFQQFPGTWEVAQIPQNIGAISFWDKVISGFTKSPLEVSEKTIHGLKPYQMRIIKFHSPPAKTPKEPDLKIVYKETASSEEEAVLLSGITEEAQVQGMGKIVSYSFFIKDASNNILGGIKGCTYYGCIYVDSLWISPELRKHGWGTKLMEKAEALGRERLCTFVSLTTMEWEALPFYKKLGYTEEYVREGFDQGQKMYVLRKVLTPDLG